MGYTHFDAPVGVSGIWVGDNGSEVQVNSAAGGLMQGGVAVTSSAVELNILTGVTATAAEINGVDVSANTQTILAAGAVTGTVAKLALVGAGAVTLAAPAATMTGRVMVIEMTVDNGDVTLALTNVAGGTAANTCTWSAVGQALVLVAGLTKWCVVSEAGVVLT